MKTPPPKQLIGIANSIEVDGDGWAFIPFGDSRHSGQEARVDVANARAKEGIRERPVIQRFDRASAEALVNHFRSTLGKIKHAIVGLPIFKGHPDASRFKKQFPDKTPRGTIADMQVVDKGLRFRPVLTEQGAEEVSGGWDEFSPYWLCSKSGEENGVPIVSPFLLKSIGLVPRGNIAGLSLVNAADDDDTDFSMKNHILKLLAAMGITLAADASDADTELAVTNACTAVATANAAATKLDTLNAEKTDLAGKLTAAETAKTALEGEKVALANAKTTAEGEVVTLKTQLAAERKERAMLLANAAVTEGRLPAAERDSTVTALCNAPDFAVEATKLASRRKALATESHARDLGKERGSRSRATIYELVNARIAEKNEDYEKAYAAVLEDPKNKDLFDALKAAKK